MKRLLFIVSMLSMAACSREKPLAVLGQIPQFQLTSQEGNPFSRAELDGHVWVADFIFTNCEGPCPRMSSHMHSIQERTGLGVKLVSFTVDPERDTPGVLLDYAKKFTANPTRWTFLTGSKETLNLLDRDAFKLGSLGAEMDHSTRFVLIDKKGRVRGYYGIADGDPVERIVADAARLEQES